MRKVLLVAMVACIVFAFGISGCNNEVDEMPESPESQTPEEQPMEMISGNETRYILDNGLVYAEIDAINGQIYVVRNEKTGIDYLRSDSSVNPLRLEIGENRQNVTLAKNAADSVELRSDSGSEQVVFTFNELTYGDKATGISCVLTFSIMHDVEYIKYNSSVEISDDGNEIARMVMLDGSGFTDGSGDEILAGPMWGGGTMWNNPFASLSFKNRVILPYPGISDQSLESGYFCLYTQESGIGIGYINSPRIAMEFDLDLTDGMRFMPRLFDPSHILGGCVPLEPGKSFKTGDVIIAPHTGDWHTMADIYRAEFQAAFIKEDGTPDYLSWDDISDFVKESDYMIRFIAGQDGKLLITYEDMYKQTVSVLKNGQQTEEPDGSRCMVWIAGQNEKGYAFDVPIMVPSYTESGGTEGITELDRKLRELGCSTFHYEHPFAVDPDGDGYFASTDPNQRTAYWNLCDHHAVCIDNEVMMNLWRDRVIPDMNLVLADALQMDQGSLQQTVCDMPGHYHGLDALSRLGSHIKATQELSIMLRDGIGDATAYLVSEGANDLLTRYMDMDQVGWHRQPMFGGSHNINMRQYTFPQFIPHYDSLQYVNGDYVSSLLRGGVCGGIVCINDAHTTTDALRREYIRFRDEIRTAKAPGFPQGFRDTAGLSVSVPEDELFIKAFTDGEKVTLTYTSTTNIENARVVVDFERIGVAGGPTREITVSNEKNKCGFIILEP